MEIFDLYDNKGILLEEKMERGGTNKKGQFHLVAHIWIKNSEGKFLMQQRNKKTDRIPHQWAATGGAVTSGEDSLTGAIRETEEEIGIKFDKDQFRLLKRFFVEDETANYITDLYLIEEDVLINDCVLDTVEVKQLKYFTLEEYKQLALNNQAWNYERLVTRVGYYDALEKS